MKNRIGIPIPRIVNKIAQPTNQTTHWHLRCDEVGMYKLTTFAIGSEYIAHLPLVCASIQMPSN